MENEHKGKLAAAATIDNNIDLTLKLGLSNAYQHKPLRSDEDTIFQPSKNPSSIQPHPSLPFKNYELQQYNMYGGGSKYANSSMTNEANYSLMYYATPSHRRLHAHNGRYCRVCGVNNTPLWRKGPAGPQTLCNACGLKHLRTTKRKP